MTDQKPSDSSFTLNPDGTSTFALREEGDSTGQTYAGVFVFKCFLNPLDQLAAGKLYRELLGTDIQNASELERFVAFSLSQLKYRIVKAPSFWKTTESMIEGNLPDTNILTLVLDKAISSESLYKEQLKKRKETAILKAAEAIKTIQETMNPKPEEKN